MEDRTYKRVNENFKGSEDIDKGIQETFKGSVAHANDQFDKSRARDSKPVSEDKVEDLQFDTKPAIPQNVKDKTNFVNSRANRDYR